MIGSFTMTTHLLMHQVSCRVFGKRSEHPGLMFGKTSDPYSPDFVAHNFWLFPKVKSLLKGKRFQTNNEIQENTIGQLIVIGRTV